MSNADVLSCAFLCTNMATTDAYSYGGIVHKSMTVRRYRLAPKAAIDARPTFEPSLLTLWRG